MLQKSDRYSIARSRYLPLAEVVLALAILAGTIAFASYSLREQSREQITSQHAQVLYNLWLSQKFSDEPETLLDTGEQASDQLPAVLETARLPQLQLANLLGTRVFDADGKCVFADANVEKTTLNAVDIAELRRMRPVARLRENANMSEVVVGLTEESHMALLEVFIPLHSAQRSQMTGVAQFILDGERVSAEFKRLDRNLIFQGSLNFLVAGGLLGAFLGLGFQQVQRANRLLAERTQSLLKANQELALAAKTSAVGAVTAHLIHGLKNPLSGLQTFVASRGVGAEDAPDSDWQLAVSSTRRMQVMIGEIVRVLQDEGGDGQYELLLGEFSDMLSAKVRPLAKEAGVRFESVRVGDGTLLNREANLLSLVLYNLVQNAIQATPPDKLVTLRISAGGGRIVCEVQDEGPGISEAQRAQLFKPCRSTKEGGSGIGLAISQQLAKCIGAQLELRETAPTGSRFVLTFPNGDLTGTEADGRGAREEPASSNPTSYSAQV